jgi:hypothetical protein
MDANDFAKLLLDNDLRTIKQNNIVIRSVNDQKSFDELFRLTFHHERTLVMRAVDAVEKLTVRHPEFLQSHKSQLLHALKSADHKELKWHIAQLIPRVDLDGKEIEDVWHILTYWTQNRNESKIERVNSLQGLFDLSKLHPEFKNDFEKTLESIEHEMIPSIQARIRRIKKFRSRSDVKSMP